MLAIHEQVSRSHLRVAIVDDDEDIRDAWSGPVRDLSYTPIPISTGLPSSLPEIVRFFRERADALLCDHRLKHVSQYSRFNGAPVVAECYRSKLPALLCTRWNEANADEIRRHRRFIPVMLSHEDSEDSCNISQGFEVCKSEHEGRFSAERRPWRALIRVEGFEFENDEVDSGAGNQINDEKIRDICFTVVGWQKRVLRVPFRDIPEGVRQAFLISSRNFLHAEVNLGAATVQDLYFSKWEPT